ncbi:Glycosyl transferase, family 2 [Conexivisphaera calida]|uniref:Glycosyl transferase, family 2 n=1 Tax=Conexivisphaera calida TaxID=1874277 RepID=A0A4P2VD08_9ARCH|nr:Glycosyl transferase, family 2 [Conexivisphaera calida]
MIVLDHGILGFSPLQVVCVLLVFIVIEVPQVLGKALLLPILEASRGRTGEGVRVTAYPKVSVIVPAHNEEQYIGNTLASLLEDTYPNKEIIVVDDGSTDKTYVKASMLAGDPRVKIVRREEPSGSKARAVNYGIPFAAGDIIVVVDGDTVVERQALKRLVEPMLEDPRVIGTAGNIKVANRVNLLTRLQAYEYLVSMELGRRWQSVLNGLLVIPGAIGAIRRDVLDSVGRVHVDTITEDFDMTFMLQKTKGRIVFSPEAIAWTYVPERLRDWIRQRIRWASGQIQVYIKHSDALLRRRLGVFGALIAPNNIFMDMIVLFVKYIWLAAIILMHWTSPFYIVRFLLLLVIFYLVLEYVQLTSAALLTPGGDGIENAILVPLILPYRELLSAVRLFAYIKTLLGRRPAW